MPDKLHCIALYYININITLYYIASFYNLCCDRCMFWRHIDFNTNTFGFLILVLNFSPRLYLHFLKVLFIGDDPHLLQQDDGDHLLGQHSPCGGETVHVKKMALKSFINVVAFVEKSPFKTWTFVLYLFFSKKNSCA